MRSKRHMRGFLVLPAAFGRSPTPVAAALALAIGAVVLSTPVAAQYELGDGTGLDRNLQRGSGGVNAPKLRNTYGVYSDAVVTGNVPGLSRFRGRVDYPAASEFRDRLGSDDLFDFNRRAYRPTGGVQRAYGQPAYDPYGGARVDPGAFDSARYLLRSGAGATTGGVSGAGSSFGPDVDVRRNDLGALKNYEQQRQRLNRPRLRTSQAASYSRHVLAVGRDEAGRRLRIETSPLRGVVTYGEAGLRGRGDAAADPGAGEAGGPIGEGPGDGGPGVDPGGLDPGRGDPTAPGADPVDPREMTLAERRRAEARVASAVYLEPRRLMLAERLGAALDDPRRAADRGEGWERVTPRASRVTLDEAVDRVLSGEMADDPSAGAEAPGGREGDGDGERPPSDPYERLLWDIRQRYAVPGEADGEAEGGEGASESDGGEESDGGASDRAIEKLDYELPAVESLAGATEARLKEAMAKAERRMGAGRYLDAADAYEQGLVYRQGYPPARVGRAHAYLGAGMFSTAAGLLRSTLADHPEMIAARYAPPLLPDAERRAALKKKLAARAEKLSNDVDAPLLLAYLAYQGRDAEAAAAELARLNQRAGGDTLVRLLSRIWSDPADAPERKATPQATSGEAAEEQ
mgnify:CR=1 FL=1